MRGVKAWGSWIVAAASSFARVWRSYDEDIESYFSKWVYCLIASGLLLGLAGLFEIGGPLLMFAFGLVVIMIKAPWPKKPKD